MDKLVEWIRNIIYIYIYHSWNNSICENNDIICLRISSNNSALYFWLGCCRDRWWGFPAGVSHVFYVTKERASCTGSVCKPQGYTHRNDETLSKNKRTRFSSYWKWGRIYSIQIDYAGFQYTYTTQNRLAGGRALWIEDVHTVKCSGYIVDKNYINDACLDTWFNAYLKTEHRIANALEILRSCN